MTEGFQRRHWWFVNNVTKHTFLMCVLLRHLCDVHVRRRTEITEALKQDRERRTMNVREQNISHAVQY